MAIENTQLVLVEYPANGVVRLVLNNESSFNALSTPMLTALEAALTKAAEEANFECVDATAKSHMLTN